MSSPHLGIDVGIEVRRDGENTTTPFAHHGSPPHGPPVCSSVYAVAARMRVYGFTVFTPTTSKYRTIQISAMVGTMTMNAWIC